MFPSRNRLDELAPLVQYEVNVTNTGNMDSDHVVLGMMVPPGAGVNGVPLQQLFGFERVHIKAGQTVTVYIYPRLSEFTQPAVDGTRVAHTGEYTFRFGIPETKDRNMGYLEHTVTAF
jgi:pre-mRNA-splicing factor SYF2/beta-D-xylosidase 4